MSVIIRVICVVATANSAVNIHASPRLLFPRRTFRIYYDARLDFGPAGRRAGTRGRVGGQRVWSRGAAAGLYSTPDPCCRCYPHRIDVRLTNCANACTTAVHAWGVNTSTGHAAAGILCTWTVRIPSWTVTWVSYMLAANCSFSRWCDPCMRHWMYT